MRILNVHKFHRDGGGAERYHLALGDLLRRQGHEVIAFAMAEPTSLPTPYARYFVSEVDLSGGQGLRAAVRGAGRLLYSWEARRKIAALVRETRPAVAHLHNIYHHLSPSILPVLAREGVPAVLTAHDLKLICPSYRMLAGGRICEACRGRHFYQAIIQRCARGSRAHGALLAAEGYLHRWLGLWESLSAIIAPSRFYRDKLVEYGLPAARVHHIPNYVKVASSPPPPEAKGYALYLGRLSPEKGVTTLLQAARLLPGRPLLIAGEGPAGESLRRQAAQQGLAGVEFLGRVGPGQLEPLLAGALFTILPSEYHENCPLAVLESMAAARPVVAARAGGIPELIRDGEDGLLVPMRDPEALASAMDGLWARPAQAREMGERARRRVLADFSEERHYDSLMALYRQVAGEGREGRARKG